jgi:hypothetical protein
LCAQQSGVPVVGFLNAASAQTYALQLAAFLKRLGVQFHPAPYFRGFFALRYDPQIVQGQDRRRHMPLEQMK